MSFFRSVKEFFFTTKEYLIPFSTYLEVMYEVYEVKDHCDEWIRIDLSTIECLIAYFNKRYKIMVGVPGSYRGLYDINFCDLLRDIPINSFEMALQEEIMKCDLRYDMCVQRFDMHSDAMMRFRDRHVILDDELSAALKI